MTHSIISQPVCKWVGLTSNHVYFVVALSIYMLACVYNDYMYIYICERVCIYVSYIFIYVCMYMYSLYTYYIYIVFFFTYLYIYIYTDLGWPLCSQWWTPGVTAEDTLEPRFGSFGFRTAGSSENLVFSDNFRV